jgi:7,8-dihydropterin-6-yl-methyl-4-(beta-D-ribofuranosyl)aminobenzene 5'-phosphate synthase
MPRPALPSQPTTKSLFSMTNDRAMKKDWGYSALVEVAGKRILFDTGNDRDVFATNVKAKKVDLTQN